MTTRGAKCICAALMCVSLFIASPQVVLYGYSSIEIANENLTGVQCFFEDHYVGSTFPIIYHGFMMTIFVTTTITLIVLYFKICKTLYMHKRKLSKLRLSKRLRRIQTEQVNTSSQLMNDENNDVEILVVLMEYGKENVTCSQRNNAESEVLENKPSDRDTSDYDTKLPNHFEKHSRALSPIPFEGQTRKTLTKVKNDGMVNEPHSVSEIKQTYIKQNTNEIQNKDNFESYLKDNPKYIGNSAYYNARKHDTEPYKLTADTIQVSGENALCPNEIITKMGNRESMDLHSDSSRDNGNNFGETVDDYSNSCQRTIRTIIQNCFCFNITANKEGEQKQMCLSKDQFIMKLLGDKRTFKITYMTFTITAVFIVSYFPSVYIMTISLLDMAYWENLSTQQTVVYELLMRSYLINSMVNPIIYGFWDERFRFECLKMIKCLKNRIV
ncbi:hypothetical protein CHS0354_025729 [Potamilus streckersoni]|uniref:G-protein coupled receptors family 1 profile domain-containing protein n=1 Tax=Potamilus streckersoni TaxID=2493646 RepID=A0AAE0S168_9BIVA|nr:hypothetical protein CHS0354_025729 [Potamilus streckersoni]